MQGLTIRLGSHVAFVAFLLCLQVRKKETQVKNQMCFYRKCMQLCNVIIGRAVLRGKTHFLYFT